MHDQSKQIIPDTNTVICLLDKAITDYLNHHDTYKSQSLLDKLWKLDSCDSKMFELLEEVLEKVYHNQSNISNSTLAKKIQAFVKENKDLNSNNIDQLTIKQSFTEGVSCNLLQPDGKGWQKGNLKICFEFTPEEQNHIVTAENTVAVQCSSLDEIRQLAHSLPIEQN